MTVQTRYAIYFVPPPESALYRFGAETIGYDAFSGEEIAGPEELWHALPDWHALTDEPRRYGFHATLKAPFVLVGDKSEDDLQTAFHTFAAATRQRPRIAPQIALISGFVAIVPSQADEDLSSLAGDCVTAFNAFRAPLSAEERQRRLRAPLTPRQIAHLDRWGYPYVFDTFRFHMTLTGRITPERRPFVLRLLEQRFARLALTELRIGHLALLRQDGPGSRFRILAHSTLGARQMA